ncbi:MFS transporter [Paenibacillus athensensis]|uniref:MFS transporter n=1 Tax=Paenibacillus athensensis TaxID=1967502 RepID=A0A4Y8Q3H1_9BACL|nr:MFS transporter [Paenibacillus athensensis]MCD1258342.1 MFS transporter [Paenibacillus athensensis]
MSDNDFLQRMGMRMSRGTWRNFQWDFSATILFSLFNVIFNQFYIPMAIHHGATSLAVGLLSASPAIGLLFSPLWANWIERTQPRPFMLYPNLIGRLLIVLPAIWTSSWVFVGVALAFQLLMGIQAPAYASLVTRMYPADLRGRLMGNVRVAMGFLMVPLSYVCGRWIDHAGSGGPLAAAALAGVLSILAFNGIKEIEPLAGPPRKPSLLDQFSILKGNKPLIVFLAATTFAGFGNMLGNPLYQIVQVQQLALSNVEIGFIRMVYFLFLMFAYWLMGWMIDRYTPKHAMYFAFGGFLLVPLLYGLFDSFPVLLVAGGLQGFADAAWDIGCMAYVFRIAPGREASVFGLHLMLFGIRGTIGPLLSTGLSHSLPMSALFLSAAACSVVALILFVLEKPAGEPKPL